MRRDNVRLHSHTRWTPEQDQAVRDLGPPPWESRLSVAAWFTWRAALRRVADQCGRSPLAVRNRVRHLFPPARQGER